MPELRCIRSSAHQSRYDLCQSVSSVASRQHFHSSTEVFSSCLAIVSAVMVGGLFLWPALRYGTGYQTVWEIWPSAETPSSIHWRRFYFQLTRVHSALELFAWCALQIYLLTYVVVFLDSARITKLRTSARWCVHFLDEKISVTWYCHIWASGQNGLSTGLNPPRRQRTLSHRTVCRLIHAVGSFCILWTKGDQPPQC